MTESGCSSSLETATDIERYRQENLIVDRAGLLGSRLSLSPIVRKNKKERCGMLSSAVMLRRWHSGGALNSRPSVIIRCGDHKQLVSYCGSLDGVWVRMVVKRS
ncbi:hypothetical protein CEXT_437581 [Caerostris extrusa]|uniref:Uncharacterized protein n=1 Tax=Caerostris extrusa TaxID=172846 RepID=A0AAV4U8Z6_CAEEX|nr:hypothetical protein CEXT_437581 [Caerostris extrusa]